MKWLQQMTNGRRLVFGNIVKLFVWKRRAICIHFSQGKIKLPSCRDAMFPLSNRIKDKKHHSEASVVNPA
jgi:hypothetical protein